MGPRDKFLDRVLTIIQVVEHKRVIVVVIDVRHVGDCSVGDVVNTIFPE